MAAKSWLKARRSKARHFASLFRPRTDMAKSKLLIVDDDEEIRTQMRWALNSEYEVVLAGDRPSALQAFRAHSPSVVLLDLGLPPKPAAPDEGLAALAELLSIDKA